MGNFGLIHIVRTFKAMTLRRSLSIAGLAVATPGLGKEESWERKTLGKGNKKPDEKDPARNPVRLRKRVTCPQGVTLDPHLGQHPAWSVAPGNWGFLVPQEVSKRQKSQKRAEWHLWLCWPGQSPARLRLTLPAHLAAFLARVAPCLALSTEHSLN